MTDGGHFSALGGFQIKAQLGFTLAGDNIVIFGVKMKTRSCGLWGNPAAHTVSVIEGSRDAEV